MSTNTRAPFPYASLLFPAVLLAALLGATAAAQVADDQQEPDTAAAEPLADDLPAAGEQAEEGPDDGFGGPSQQDAAPSLPANRLEALIELRALVEDERYEEAIPVGEQLVRLSEAEFGQRSRETAEAMAELADAQRRAEQHRESEYHFLQAIETFRDVEGPYSVLLLEPLLGLGDNYRGAGDYQNAVSAYNEARTVSRRVFGLLSEEQIPILDRMSATLVSMNLHGEAGEHQLAALELVERNHPPGSPEMLEALYKYGAWLRQVGRFREERSQYNRAMQLIRNTEGRDHPNMIRPLREIGNSFRTQRIADNQGANALQRATNIVEEQEQVDPLLVAELMRDIGDWQVAFSRGAPDVNQYRQAWRLLGEIENAEELRRQWFSGPVYVLREPVSQTGLSNDPQAVRGHVLVQFEINEAGRAEDLVIVSAEPEGFKEDAVAQSVRRSRFRPQMQDGEIVRGERVAMQFVYRYQPDNR